MLLRYERHKRTLRNAHTWRVYPWPSLRTTRKTCQAVAGQPKLEGIACCAFDVSEASREPTQKKWCGGWDSRTNLPVRTGSESIFEAFHWGPQGREPPADNSSDSGNVGRPCQTILVQRRFRRTPSHNNAGNRQFLPDAGPDGVVECEG